MLALHGGGVGGDGGDGGGLGEAPAERKHSRSTSRDPAASDPAEHLQVDVAASEECDH